MSFNLQQTVEAQMSTLLEMEIESHLQRAEGLEMARAGVISKLRHQITQEALGYISNGSKDTLAQRLRNHQEKDSGGFDLDVMVPLLEHVLYASGKSIDAHLTKIPSRTIEEEGAFIRQLVKKTLTPVFEGAPLLVEGKQTSAVELLRTLRKDTGDAHYQKLIEVGATPINLTLEKEGIIRTLYNRHLLQATEAQLLAFGKKKETAFSFPFPYGQDKRKIRRGLKNAKDGLEGVPHVDGTIVVDKNGNAQACSVLETWLTKPNLQSPEYRRKENSVYKGASEGGNRFMGINHPAVILDAIRQGRYMEILLMVSEIERGATSSLTDVLYRNLEQQKVTNNILVSVDILLGIYFTLIVDGKPHPLYKDNKQLEPSDVLKNLTKKELEDAGLSALNLGVTRPGSNVNTGLPGANRRNYELLHSKFSIATEDMGPYAIDYNPAKQFIFPLSPKAQLAGTPVWAHLKTTGEYLMPALHRNLDQFRFTPPAAAAK